MGPSEEPEVEERKNGGFRVNLMSWAVGLLHGTMNDDGGDDPMSGGGDCGTFPYNY